MPTKRERRRIERLIEAQEEKVAPGPGWRPVLDRIAWRAAGQTEAGKWNPRWILHVGALAIYAWAQIHMRSPAELFITVAVLAALVLRGRFVHERYMRWLAEQPPTPLVPGPRRQSPSAAPETSPNGHRAHSA